MKKYIFLQTKHNQEYEQFNMEKVPLNKQPKNHPN